VPAGCPKYVESAVVNESGSHYAYAPSLIRLSDGTYQYYACWAPDAKGDLIGWKNAATLASLKDIPFLPVLERSPPNASPSFDTFHTCDPSIIRSRKDGRFYLHYGGESDPMTKGLGVAVSDKPGGPFRKLGRTVAMPDGVYRGGDPCSDDSKCPIAGCETKKGTCLPPYGIGQPSVTEGPEGYYYLVYTSQVRPVSDDALIVVRSKDISFRTGVESVARLAPPGWSVNLSIDPSRKEFLITVPGERDIIVVHYDLAFQQIGSTAYRGGKWTAAEGVALLADEYQRPLLIGGNYVFASATPGVGSASHTRGPNVYQSFRPATASLGKCAATSPKPATNCRAKCASQRNVCLGGCGADIDCKAACSTNFADCLAGCPPP
jgi:hypothetical protein